MHRFYNWNCREGEYMNQQTSDTKLQKYDISLEDDMNMYDNQPYSKDPDLCNTNNVRLVSGNVIKYYQSELNSNNPYIIETHDEEVKEKIEQMRKEQEESIRIQEETVENIQTIDDSVNTTEVIENTEQISDTDEEE